MTNPTPTADVEAWQHQVRQHFPSPLAHHAARLLANQLRTPGTSHVELHPQAVHQLLLALHLLRPPGLRRLLTKLAHAGLLTPTQPGTGPHWGRHQLTLPAHPTDQTSPGPAPTERTPPTGPSRTRTPDPPGAGCRTVMS